MAKLKINVRGARSKKERSEIEAQVRSLFENVQKDFREQSKQRRMFGRSPEEPYLSPEAREFRITF